MKINWGTKIAIFYSSFVIFILSLVYMSFGQKFDLVTEDYYAQELKFQQKIDSKIRASKLEDVLSISIDNEVLNINFPSGSGEIQGSIHCFRPSDENKDFILQINAVNDLQQIPLSKMSKGKYLFKIDWQSNGEKYYSEQIVIIP